MGFDGRQELTKKRETLHLSLYEAYKVYITLPCTTVLNCDEANASVTENTGHSTRA